MQDPLIRQAESTNEFDMKTEDGRNHAREAEVFTEAMKQLMSPKGALKLPELLDSRRLALGIPDGAFRVQAMFDRILIWQLSWGDGIHAPNSIIHLTDVMKDVLQESAPRGLIVSAGLKAMDTLRSNGMDLGHIVTFNQLAPYRIPCEWVRGKEQHVVVINVGNIVGSEDAALAQKLGLCKVDVVETSTWDTKGHPLTTAEHLYQDPTGRTWVPELPWRSGEY